MSISTTITTTLLSVSLIQFPCNCCKRTWQYKNSTYTYNSVSHVCILVHSCAWKGIHGSSLANKCPALPLHPTVSSLQLLTDAPHKGGLRCVEQLCALPLPLWASLESAVQEARGRGRGKCLAAIYFVPLACCLLMQCAVLNIIWMFAKAATISLLKHQTI